jgi:hypothetical protein
MRLSRQFCSFCRRNYNWKAGGTPESASNLGVYSCGRRQCARYFIGFMNNVNKRWNWGLGRFRSYPEPVRQRTDLLVNPFPKG